MEPLKFNTLDDMMSGNPANEATRQAMNSIRSTQVDVPHFDLPPHFVSPIIDKMENAKKAGERQYVLANQSGQYGPYSILQIKESLAAGTVNSEMYVWTQGYQDWVKIDECEDFANFFSK